MRRCNLAPDCLEAAFDSLLGVRVHFALRAHANTCRAEERAAGRAALQSVMDRLGRQGDANRMSLPATGLTISHSGAMALAAGTPEPVGLGVDIERRGGIAARAARFFLVAAERRWLAGIDARLRERALLRTWTVKEALFKACAANRNTLLTDYVLEEPAASSGLARSLSDGSRYAYASVEVPGGFVSAARAQPGGGNP